MIYKSDLLEGREQFFYFAQNNALLCGVEIFGRENQGGLYYVNRESLCTNSLIAIYTINGEGFFECETENFTLSSGDLLIFDASFAHSYGTKHHSWEIVYFHFSNIPIPNNYSFPLLVKDFKFSEILDLYNKFKQFFSSPCQKTDLLFSKHAHFFIIDALLKFSETSPPNLFEQILDFINKKSSEKITIGSICEEFYISPSTILRMFKNNSYPAPYNYINDIRLRNFENISLVSDLPIETIAKDCGFSDLTFFYKKFKEKYGTTPRKMKKQH